MVACHLIYIRTQKFCVDSIVIQRMDDNEVTLDNEVKI